MTPFDFSKSVTQTKEDLSSDEYMFEKEYNPFIVNRILSMSPQTALFAGAMNQLPMLSKQMQYKFYLKGIPKSTRFSKYIKKESDELNQVHINFIASFMNVSLIRATEVYSLVGDVAVQKMIDSKGGNSP